MSFNRAAEEITGTRRSEAIGRYRWEVFRSNMVSRRKGRKKIFNILPQVADSDSTVLLEGETGTGKELMANSKLTSKILPVYSR